MSLMMGLLILWGALTAVLVILLIYRGTLSIHEDDQIHLDANKSSIQTEHEEVLVRLEHLQPYVRALAALSGALILIIAGLFIYRSASRIP